MKFLSHPSKEALNGRYDVFRTTELHGEIIDVWLAERGELESFEFRNWQLVHSDQGLWGTIQFPLDWNHAEEAIAQIQFHYVEMMKLIADKEGLELVRIWNYVPEILSEFQNGVAYHYFNEARFKAFECAWPNGKAYPAASAIGISGHLFTLEFFAAPVIVQALENKEQKPAAQYSEKYGSFPPLFSRGVIIDNLGQRLLLASGTASVIGEDSHFENIYDQTERSILNLRILAGQFNLKGYGIGYGFAWEDIQLLRVYYKKSEDLTKLQTILAKAISPNTQVSYLQADICRQELLVEMEAIFVKKGEYEDGHNSKYAVHNGKIRTESVELHVTEHCNLRCRDCCNISPFNPQTFLTKVEFQEYLEFIGKHLRPDVLKLAGGEPTLHPELEAFVVLAKEAKVAHQVRVVSNGLLMLKYSDRFWAHLDQLTISNYKSAPVKPRILDHIREKCRAFGVFLNIKYVDQFNEIFVEEPIQDASEIQTIYDDCWMRHRCLIFRKQGFHKCTRASYMDTFLVMQGISSEWAQQTYSAIDGISLKEQDFLNTVLTYLNSTEPLASCRYCLGVSGPLRENVQLTKEEVNAFRKKVD